MTHLVPLGPGSITEPPIGVEQGAKYTVIGPDGTRAVFNDVHDRDFVGYLTEPPSGIDGAEVRESSDTLVEDDGAIHGTFYFGRRPIVFTGIIDFQARDEFGEYVEVLTEVGRNEMINPSFELNTSGWTFSSSAAGQAAATLTREATMPPTNGAWDAQYNVTRNDAITVTVLAQQGTASMIPVTEGDIWTLNADMVNVQDSYNGPRARVQWWKPDGSTTNGTSSGVIQPNGAGARTLSLTIAVPEGSGYANPQIANVYPGDAVVRTWVTKFDSVLFTKGLLPMRGGTAIRYYDGASPDFTDDEGNMYRTAWSGTPHLSSSILYQIERVYFDPAKMTNLRINRLQRACRALRDDARIQWTPAGGVPVEALVRRNQPIRHAQRLPKSFLVPLVAADPRIVGQAQRSVSRIGNGSVTADNDGNGEGHWTATLTGAFTNPIITNGATGEDIRLTLTTIGTDVIVIDSASKTITLNGLNRYGALDFVLSEWWMVQPGDNVITLAGAGAGSPAMRIDWRDTWLS